MISPPNLEGELDDISAGDRAWREVLRRFWRDFSAALERHRRSAHRRGAEAIDEALAPHLYPPRADGSDPRECPLCHQGRLHLKTARSGGAFIGCGAIPNAAIPGRSAPRWRGRRRPRVLGRMRAMEISLKNGRFGPYVQRGEATEEVPKPPRASVPKGWDPASLDLERALALLALPREIGPHPEDGVLVEAGIGRYGPYVKHGRKYANLPDVDEVFTIGMNRAVEVLAQPSLDARAARRRRPRR
jgi:DNA topoisomerase-1